MTEIATEDRAALVDRLYDDPSRVSPTEMHRAADLIEADGKRLALAGTAPHMDYCQFSYLSGEESLSCTCWKADYNAAKEAGL